MHKDYLVLNNLKWLICYIIQPKQIVKILYIYIYQICTICFGWIIWHINYFKLFNTK